MANEEYTLQHTAVEVDNAVGKALSIEANPTLVGTEAALTGLQVGDTKYKVDSGISQDDADARYLKLAGGTMNGNIKLGTSNKFILNSNSEAVVGVDANGRTCMGTSSPIYLRTMAGNSIFHSVGATDYTVLDANNTSANPTLSGGETTLSSLKLNGTNYAVGGTEVVANPTLAGTESALTGLQVADTKYALKYLALAGGEMTGDIIMADTKKIKVKSYGNERDILTCNYSGVQLGNGSAPAQINTNNTSVYHQQAGNSYVMLDAYNTSANPGNTTATLTSLKLNGTNYAIAGGTQVTFVDWS